MRAIKVSIDTLNCTYTNPLAVYVCVPIIFRGDIFPYKIVNRPTQQIIATASSIDNRTRGMNSFKLRRISRFSLSKSNRKTFCQFKRQCIINNVIVERSSMWEDRIG